MPRMTVKDLSVAANAVSANVVSGQLYEFLSRRTKLVIAAAGSAVGLNMSVSVGGIILMNDQPISDINRFPQIPEDISLVEIAGPGRMIITFRNTTGGALTVEAVIDIS